ncbi:MAG: type II toxin-antitoxin system HicB family antitoxin [Spirochaetaceae bacterium]|nr:type II toxin-antitoxin system HicB family antitoxin [Spirochaetaceae bacterium]
MKDVLTYKEYMGSVHFNAEDEVFYGKIEGIEDLVSFEGKSVDELKEAFEAAVDDYMDICKRTNKDIEKSYKGNFNVRIPPELHRRIKRTAVRMGISLNQFMQKAVEDELTKENISN